MPPPGGEEARDAARVASGGWEAAARERVARDGVEIGAVWVAGGAEWRRVATGSAGLAHALGRSGLPGLRVEARGRSFCARTAGGPDCLFVSVVGPPGPPPAVHDVAPELVEAVVLVEPAPPDPDTVRMLWRAELTTGRLVLFLRGWDGGGPAVREPAVGSLSR